MWVLLEGIRWERRQVMLYHRWAQSSWKLSLISLPSKADQGNPSSNFPDHWLHGGAGGNIKAAAAFYKCLVYRWGEAFSLAQGNTADKMWDLPDQSHYKVQSLTSCVMWFPRAWGGLEGKSFQNTPLQDNKPMIPLNTESRGKNTK